jgi:hypothetical protein
VLTETLNETLDVLAKQKNENERLRTTIRSLEQDLARKEKALSELSAELEGDQGKVQELEQSLERWKADILGFREEMRLAEEAEIEVLRKILVLLQDLSKETESS